MSANHFNLSVQLMQSIVSESRMCGEFYKIKGSFTKVLTKAGTALMTNHLSQIAQYKFFKAAKINNPK